MRGSSTETESPLEGIMSDEKKWEPCSEGCKGWLHFDDPLEIERCDECGRFKTDEEAVAAHRVECGCPWPEVDYQDAVASWVRDIRDVVMIRDLKLVTSDPALFMKEVENMGRLADSGGVEFMDDVKHLISSCSRLMETMTEGVPSDYAKVGWVSVVIAIAYGICIMAPWYAFMGLPVWDPSAPWP